MSPLQRRTFAACIFAFCFILFYEARGERLLSWMEAPELRNAGLEQIYWENAGAGIFVLCIGTLLLFGLKRPGAKPVFSFLELAVYALGFGILVGTALVSWWHIRH